MEFHCYDNVITAIFELEFLFVITKPTHESVVLIEILKIFRA